MISGRVKQLARRIGRLESRIFSLELRKGEAYRELRELSKIRGERICSHCGTEENVDWCSNCDQYECVDCHRRELRLLKLGVL